MTLPSWDIIVLILIGAWMAYAFLILRGRVMGSLLAAYTAYLVTITWGPNLYGLLSGQQAVFGYSLSLPITEFAVRSGLLVILWLLLASFVTFSKRKRLPELEIIAHSFLTVAFILSSIATFMNEEQRALLGNRTVIAEFLGRYHNLLILIPVILILYSSVHAHED